MNEAAYSWIENKVTSYICGSEELKIDDFHFHPDDKNSVAFIIKRVNELKQKYTDADEAERFNLITRALMLFTGLALFEYVTEE